jgi:hypothetical protein
MPKHRVLPDLTDDFNRVVLEYEAENVTELWVTGSREILSIV